jgi:hypothetical protein
MILRHCVFRRAIATKQSERERAASFDAYGQNPVSLTSFDVKRPLQIAIVDVAIG